MNLIINEEIDAFMTPVKIFEFKGNYQRSHTGTYV